MCCCGKPTVNGEPGYRWQPNDMPSIRPVNPPDLQDGDKLIFDEPGRCGGLDSHCHHYRLVVTSSGAFHLLVRHGGGDQRIGYLSGPIQHALAKLDSSNRYWTLNTIYHAYSDGKRQGRDESSAYWRIAAIEKRIKIRRRQGSHRVEIVPRVA